MYKRQARGLLRAAQEQAEAEADKLLQQARAEARQIQAEAEEKAARLTQARLDAQREQDEALKQQAADRMDRAVAWVVGRIVK